MWFSGTKTGPLHCLATHHGGVTNAPLIITRLWRHKLHYTKPREPPTTPALATDMHTCPALTSTLPSSSPQDSGPAPVIYSSVCNLFFASSLYCDISLEQGSSLSLLRPWVPPSSPDKPCQERTMVYNGQCRARRHPSSLSYTASSPHKPNPTHAFPHSQLPGQCLSK